jgi:proteic killer suppression protein
MIRSFADKETERFFLAEKSSRIPSDLLRRAFGKLALLDSAKALNDLRMPSGNRLEILAGNRAVQHSIRINDQWRVCFRWSEGAHDVEITDYHKKP